VSSHQLGNKGTAKMPLDFNFDAVADILACPECRGRLIRVDDGLICGQGEHRLRFPVVDGIPRLLVDEASELTEEEWKELSERHERTEN
jgi:uncharacterized protein